MKQQPPNNSSNSKQDQSTLDDQKRSEIDSLVQNALKKRGDTAVHIAVTNDNPVQLRQLLDRGLRVFNQSEADGGTPLHRAAEIGSQECAKILLEFNADIDALNFVGQTAFHVAAEKQDYEFGKYLIKFRARKNCRSGCKKCRFFVKQIERYDKSKKELEEQEKLTKLEESKKQKQEIQDQKLVDDMSQLSLLDEIERCRKEMGGPFFNKKENQILREKQVKYRAEETIRTQKPNKPAAIPASHEQVAISLETPVVVEQIRSRRSQQQQNSRSTKKNDSPRDDELIEPTSQNLIRQHDQIQPQQSSFQPGRDMIGPRQPNQNTYVHAQNDLIMNRQVDNLISNPLCHNQSSGIETSLAAQTQASNSLRQNAKKQKRKRCIEELEEEKNAGQSPTNQPHDSDQY